MRNKINDKEIYITENQAINLQQTTLTDLNYRLEYHTIGDKTYVVVAREKENATDTPLSIVKRLIENRSVKIITGESKRTRCLTSNGGKQL